MELKVKIDLPSFAMPPIRYILMVMSKHIGIEFEEVGDGQDVLISSEESAGIRISSLFLNNYEKHIFDHQHWFDQEPMIVDDGLIDLLGSCFYMLACAQEYHTYPKDQYGRFQFEESYQQRFHCGEEDLVSQYFETLRQQLNLLESPSKQKSIFLTHDIDRVYGSLRSDGYYSLKTGHFGDLLKVATNSLFGRSQWLNMERIALLEKQYGFHSTFFWIPLQGEAKGITNADYDLQKPLFREELKKVETAGSVNALHKSSHEKSYVEEKATI
ncbi:MAG: hypothetical protein IH946_08655 [Bacteroidetes bacterium]|nr:hypothetical protein [Bacteroidota bacterium]